jgi:hypothetical protein
MPAYGTDAVLRIKILPFSAIMVIPKWANITTSSSLLVTGTVWYPYSPDTIHDEPVLHLGMNAVLLNLLTVMVGQDVPVATALKPNLARAQVPRFILLQVDLGIKHVLHMEQLRSRYTVDQCCGSGMFIPDQKDSGSRIRIKEFYNF